MKSFIKQFVRKYLRLMCVLLAFIILGILIIISVKASVTYIAAEPERGTTTEGVHIGQDDEASKNRYVRFGTVQHQGSGMSVQGNRILKNGQPHLVRGFNMRALLKAPFCDHPSAVEAYGLFGEAEMVAAKDKWSATTLRFQVSQPGLTRSDLSQADYDEYLNTILVPAVKLASSHGLNIILSMQTQKRSCPDSPDGNGDMQPSQESLDAWNQVVPAVKAALSPPAFRNVMFELFNEPRGEADRDGWAQWLNGGIFPITEEQNNGRAPVGHQAVVDTIRAAGATTNVLIAEGMRLAHTLDGVPFPNDPSSGPDQIAYAFHGYFYADEGEYTADKAQWDRRFGNLTATKPVLMTEWHYGGSRCGTYAETVAEPFRQYLYDRNIGMTPGPFDGIDGALIYDDKWSPTDCSFEQPSRRGSGVFVQNYYKQLAEEDI